jgi:hypothetical protein
MKVFKISPVHFPSFSRRGNFLCSFSFITGA